MSAVFLLLALGIANASLPAWPTDFKWSSAGIPLGYNCAQIYESADPHTWHDNYFCWKSYKANPGIRWNSAGPIDDMRCTRILESVDPHTWHDNYLCVPWSSPYRFSWSSSGEITGKSCIKWVESADPHTWNDNFLCHDTWPAATRYPSFPSEFRWSSAGVPVGYDCEQIHESADPHTWNDNFFCWKHGLKNPGLRWSSAGAGSYTSNMRCVHIHETAEPSGHTWMDNYLCVPNDSPYRFRWSSAGPISGKKCIRWLETADPHTWSDNYLCHE